MKKHRLLLISFLLFYNVLATAQVRQISLKASNEPIKEVFRKIENAGRYNIVFSDDIVSDSILVNIDVKQQAVSEILDQLLTGTGLFYKIISQKMIVIGPLNTSELYLSPNKLNSVSGRLMDKEKVPVSFASVNLLKNDTYLTGVTSDENGYFELMYPFELNTSYQLKVTSISYETLEVDFTFPDTAVLKQLLVKHQARSLAEVSVIASRPLIERQVDRYVVNVEGGLLANGYNGLEVLQKSPGLWVTSDGSIKIKGNQSVMVMINDVVQRMSEADLAEYLRSVRSEDISKIEIIANPPSEFEAAGSGGIIHIILKKTRQDGLLGSLMSQYRQQVERPAYSSGLSLNYKLNKLYLSGNISAGKDESEYIARYRIDYADQSRYQSQTERYNDNSRLAYRLGATYDISARQAVSIQHIFNSSAMNQYFDTGIDISESSQPLTGSAHSEWFRRPKLGGTTVNYALKLDTLGSNFKFIGDYIYSRRTELNDFASVYSLPARNSTFRNNTPNLTNLFSVQADYTKLFKSLWEFKAGLKLAATERDNEVINEHLISGEWVLNTGLSNRFIYKETLSMAYLSVARKFGKLSAKAGLRAEETTMNGNSITASEKFKRSYINFFPTLFITHDLNKEKGNSVFLSYSRRLQRPAFNDLNPYRIQFDDYLAQLGNPDLMPEFTHKVELGTALGIGISGDIYYAITNDKIAQLARPVSDNTIEYQSRNFNNSVSYGISLYAPFKIASWWNSSTNFDLFNMKYRIDDFSIRQTTFQVYTQQSFTIQRLFDMDASLYYQSPYVSANTHFAHRLSVDYGITKKFFEKKLTMRFYAGDVFNTSREKDITSFNNTRIDFYQKRPTRTFSLSASYSFSSGNKFSNKNIEQSAEDEKRRIGN